MVTATIAHNALRGDKAVVIQKAAALLEKHPFYAQSWKAKLQEAPVEERAMMIFTFAATWADDVRTNRSFHHGAWHYINYPFVPKEQPRKVRGRDPQPDNIVSAFNENVKIVRDTSRRDADRAIALAWIFHLIGDVHQPLHTVALFTTQWPDGDRGGNDFYVRAREDNQPINLHLFWDGLILGSDRMQSVRNTSIRIATAYPRKSLREMRHDQFRGWARESEDLAKSHVYLEGKLPGSSLKPAPGLSATQKQQYPALTQRYRDTAKIIGERRAALAGYRLADTLEKLFD